VLRKVRKMPSRVGKGHQGTGARSHRRGLLTTWVAGNGAKVYFDNLTNTARQDRPGRAARRARPGFRAIDGPPTRTRLYLGSFAPVARAPPSFAAGSLVAPALIQVTRVPC
jgi:hypothetical protein